MPGLTGEIRLTQGRLMLLCALLSVLIYGGTLGGGFINYDDSGFIGTNPYIDGPLVQFVSFAFSSFELGIWHPLTWFSFWVDHAIWNGSVTGYRVGNLVLHILDSILVCILAFRLAAMMGVKEYGQRLLAASVVGIGFAIHPLHVEPVAWVASRKDVLYSFFWLLAIYFYLDHAEGRGRYGASILMFCMSILSKPMAMTLPAVLLLLDYYPLGRFRGGNVTRVLLEKVPFFLFAGFSAFMAVLAQSLDVPEALLAHGFMTRMWISVRALSVYAVDFIWPFVRVPAKSAIESVEFLGVDYIGSFMLLFAALGVALYNVKRRPVIFFSLAFYVITISPVIGLLNFSNHGTADRFMYVPMIGMLALAASGALWIYGRWPARRVALRAALVFVVFVLTLFSSSYAQIWTSPESFWSNSRRTNPGDTGRLFSYGYSLFVERRYEEAVPYFETVVEHEPDNVDALRYFVRTLYSLRRYEDVLKYTEQGLIVSRLLSDADSSSTVSELYATRGRVFIELKQFHKALIEFDTAIAYMGDYAKAYAFRALVRDKLSDHEGAHTDIARAIELDPENPLPHYIMFEISKEAGELVFAEQSISRVIELQPETLMYCERAELYEQMGKEELAAADRKACGL